MAWAAEPIELSADVALEADFEADALSFVVRPGAGRHCRVSARQGKADLLLRLYAPDGAPLAEIDSRIAGHASESVRFVADVDGAYRVDVLPSPRAKPVAERIEVKVDELRLTEPTDAERIALERLVARAERLRFEPRAEARREALAIYEEALPRLAAAPDRVAEADAISSTGELHFHLGDLELARAAFEKALPLARATNDVAGEAELVNNLGVVLRMTGAYELAAERYAQALALRRVAGDRRGEAQSLSNLGVVHAMLDEYQTALDHFANALVLRREVGDRRGEAHTLHSIGAAHFALGELERAIAYEREALALRQATGDAWGEAQSHESMGRALREQGDTAGALEEMRKALASRLALGDTLGEGSTRLALGELLGGMGRRDEAKDELTAALALHRKLLARRAESDTLQALGELHAARGEPDLAASHLEQALALRRALGDRSGQARTLATSAAVARSQGRLPEARDAAAAAVALSESLHAEVDRADLRDTFRATHQAWYELYVEVLVDLHRAEPAAGHLATAFAVSERKRARGLREMLAEARADVRRGVDPSLLAASTALRDELRVQARVRQRLADSANTDERLAAVNREIDRLLAESHALDARIRRESPAYAGLLAPPEPDAAAVQALLDPDTVLLEYALGARRSFLWVVTRDALEVVELPARDVIDGLVRTASERLRESHTRAGRMPSREAMARLADAVLRPVAGRLRSRVVIVPDGTLHYVPFAALPIPGAADGRPLVVDHELAHLPSAATLALLRHERPRATRAAAVFADPVLDAGDERVVRRGVRDGASHPGPHDAALTRALANTGGSGFLRLIHTRREAEAITALVPRTAALTAMGFDATREAALAAQLVDFRIVHFATHTLLDSRNPELSGVVLSLVDRAGLPQDGYLRLQDVYNLTLHADLVVLSACRTALGREVRGEGLVGLTRGFLYAGAPSVVASLWDVRDESTSELMKRFYTAMLRHGLTPAAALRKAQVSMLREPRFAAPFHWAAFVLQGDWR